MVNVIIGFVLKYWQIILLVAVVVGGYIHYQSVVHERDNLREQNIVLVEQKKICEANTKSLETSLDNINKSLDKVVSITQNQEAKFDKLARDIQIRVTDIKTGVEKIVKGYKPQTCEEAIKYLIDARKEYQK